MARIRLHALLILCSALFYYLLARLQDLAFPHVEFSRGIGWIYLPAGARLLCPLLFGFSGALGVMFGSWVICFFYLYPDDPLRALAGGVSSAIAPYLVYRLSLALFGMQDSLRQLSSTRLLMLVPIFGLASPLMHHLWFWLHGDAVDLGRGFAVMALGDMAGALLVIYALKALLGLCAPGPAALK